MKSRSLQTTVGVVRLATAASLVFAMVWQISDRLAHNVFRPGEYFAYFTIDSSMVAAVALAVAGVWAIQGKAETAVMNRVRLSVATYAIVVGVVYNALLRGLPGAAEDGNYVWPQAPNEILHVWALVFIFLDFVLTTVANPPKFKQIWWVLLFPLAWVLFTILRGMATGWWPYWFLNPTDKGGVSQMIEYIFGIMAFMLVSAVAATGATKLIRRG
ncbi:MAG: Pr6Pr family membrane protein [Rhodoluna sp.]|nr:Pr6Pr family membrane protein [Rhodoluna sp.]